MAVRVGVDAGGTFTDVCVMEEDGTVRVLKTPSTPADPGLAIVGGTSEALEIAGIAAGSVSYFGHGTTVATNALLQRAGARTGVITSLGFRDLLDLGRQDRPDLYDLQVDKAPPLALRRHRLEVPERMRYDGSIETPLDEEAVRRALRRLREQDIAAIAVCFLYSYLYPEHESRVARLAAEEHPDAFISLSHQVLAEFREYERLSTTAVNAFVGPLMAAYIDRLSGRLREAGIEIPPHITQSNGGVISVEVARRLPVRTVLSGPAAGVTGAGWVAETAGGNSRRYGNIITFDMGGTSTDVSLIDGGLPRSGTEMQVAGYPIRIPMIDINTVGAGGGSIAWIDSGGHLKVGPESAGAEPGPAGYGLGGVEATVTDANIALGILSRQQLLGGEMAVDAGAADGAVDRLAGLLGLEQTAVANGILAVVTANMARAIRVISIERGYDPRDFAMVAFGGAGPLHAARLARELEIPAVIVPRYPGILCALGLLCSDLRSDFTRTITLPAIADSLSQVNRRLTELEDDAADWLTSEGVAAEDRSYRRIVDMRYVGQNFELPIELADGPLNERTLRDVLERFDVEHDRSYGFAAPGEPAQFITLRLEARGRTPTLQPALIEAGSGEPVPAGERPVYLTEAGGWLECPVYQRDDLLAGKRFSGPAIVEQMDSTTLVLPGQQVDVDPYGNLIISETGGS